MCKVSVIVPVYNVEKYLFQCIESIVNQTYRNLEIICVDDGSPDNCGKMLDEYAKKDERIKVIHQVNGGLSAARNTGLENATGDWISFVDSDDYIEKDFYEKLIKASLKGKFDVVQCGYITFGGEFDRTVIWDKLETGFFVEIIQGLKRGFVCNKLWKSSLIKENNLRFKKGIYLEDVLFSIIAANYVKNFIRIEYAGYYYRANPNSITGQKSNKDKIRQDTYIICKEVLKFYEDIDITNAERDILKRVVFLMAFSPWDLLDKIVYKKCLEIFNSSKMLKKFKRKALREWLFRLSFSRKEMIILGRKFSFFTNMLN